MTPLRFAAAVTVLAALAVGAPVGGATFAHFGPAKEVTLPAGSSGVPSGYLPTLVCPAAGDCVAAGAYTDARGAEEGLILTESHGVWRAPTTLVAPPGAGAGAGVTIDGLACAAVGACTLGGSFDDAQGNQWPFVAVDVKGSWHRAVELELPANALAAGQQAQVRSVACPAVGTCVAVGTYLDDATPVARSVAFVEDETGARGAPRPR